MKWYGLVGKPLTHSFSKKYFTHFFAANGITGCRYENFELPSIESLPQLLKDHPDLCGLNVTIPYKEQVIAYIDFVSEDAAAIGACNCIRIRNGRLEGFNTDVTGFTDALQDGLQPHHRQALVFGTGGASKAICHALHLLGIAYRQVSRTAGSDRITYDALTNEMIAAHPLLINTSPVGTYPDVDAQLPIPYEGISAKHLLFDVVYNPPRTRFLQEGAARGATVINGERMLLRQAEESWEIWNKP
jgi:shikimate dehydrogenase